MPAALNIAWNLVLGATLVHALPRSPALRRGFVNWLLLALMAFEALCVTPVATYLLRFYPQWSLFYAFDPQLYPELDRWLGPLSALAVLLNFAAAAAGYAVARHGLVHGRRWLALAPIGVGAMAGLAMAGLLFDRVIFIADFDTFWQGHGVFFGRRLAGVVGLACCATAVAFVVLLRRRFAKHDPQLL